MIWSRLPWKLSLAAIFFVAPVASDQHKPACAETVDELYKLTAAVPSSQEGFGQAVAISGNRAIVGTAGFLLPGAYVFDVPTGQQLHKLSGADTARFDGFGTSVAIDDQIAVVGAPRSGFVSGNQGRGAAYLFDIVTGQQLFRFSNSDGSLNDLFGESVAVSGNVAVIGAPGNDNGHGAAYVFDAQSGQQLRKLVAGDESPFNASHFGRSVAIDGNLAIVGVGPNEAGAAAYVFDVQTGQQLYKLTPSDRSSGWLSSVAISGHMVTVGVPDNNEPGLTDAGAAYVFNALTGQELFKLTAPDPAAYDFFGGFVSISNNLAVIGAINADLPQGVDAGAAFLFDLTTGQQIALLTASDAKAHALFGTVGISSNRIIIGAPGQNGLGTGSAYLYEIVPEPSAHYLALLLMFGVTLSTDRRWP
jgi:outer membrane protein assembly factor BamB